MNKFRLCFVTISVTSLAEAERFYVDILGFEVTRRYEPTLWISLGVDECSGGFGLIEAGAEYAPPPDNTVDILINNLDAYWDKIQNKVKIVSPLQRTPWGSYKAIIQDPSGNRIGLVESPIE